MSSLISVIGLASGKLQGAFAVVDPRDNLLTFLRGHGIPVGSSCGGEGICRKCVVNGENLSCMMSVGQFLELFPDGKVEISYL